MLRAVRFNPKALTDRVARALEASRDPAQPVLGFTYTPAQTMTLGYRLGRFLGKIVRRLRPTSASASFSLPPRGSMASRVSTDATLEQSLSRFVEDRVRLSTRHHHVEDLTIEFLRSHLAEADPSRPKQREWLTRWDQRGTVTPSARQVREVAYGAIRERMRQLQQTESDKRATIGKLRAEQIATTHSGKIDKFVEIAYRKVATPDDYGDENPAALDDEIRRLLRKLAEIEPELKSAISFDKGRGLLGGWVGFHPIAGPFVQILRERFHTYYRARKARPQASPSNEMGGIEFELHVSEALRSCGVSDVSTTPATGDQGADLLFTMNGRKYVVQAKRYSGSVGNKAIQEAHAAKGFYGCDLAWVVTNSRFTPAAVALANQLDVVLVDGESLSNFSEFAERAFAQPR